MFCFRTFHYWYKKNVWLHLFRRGNTHKCILGLMHYVLATSTYLYFLLHMFVNYFNVFLKYPIFVVILVKSVMISTTCLTLSLPKIPFYSSYCELFWCIGFVATAASTNLLVLCADLHCILYSAHLVTRHGESDVFANY